MWHNEELFEKFDLLLPEKFDGGYLVIALYLKIKGKELDRYFTTSDIKHVLAELSSKYGETQSQAERVINQLRHFYIRNVSDDLSKYYLTDFAEELVELLLNRLENPYKNHPLKESFSKYFSINSLEAGNIYVLEQRFGREFVKPHKRIINNHLASLDESLRMAVDELNTILNSPEESATVLVKKFVNVFKQFGEKAEDIINAIATKDQFLYSLHTAVDNFYAAMITYKPLENEGKEEGLDLLKKHWEMARAIDEDLQDFFRDIDEKIDRIRDQIIIASEKLSELQEQFSSRSNFRMKIKALLQISLENAVLKDKEIQFVNEFPQKAIVCEETKLFHPGNYDFSIPQYNVVIQIPKDEAYERMQRKEIQRDNRRQQLINEWVSRGKDRLKKDKLVFGRHLIEEIMLKEEDLAIAHQVMIELTQFVSDDNGYKLVMDQVADKMEDLNLIIWKMQFEKVADTTSS